MKNNYPEFVIANGKKYKINTDFRVAIECNRVSEDKNINDYERSLAIIYLLFGKDALYDKKNHKDLLNLALKYLACGNEIQESKEQPDMDFIEDEKYIKSSFKYDYNYDPYSLDYLHWYEFFNDLCNLSYSEMGNCCILNRIRDLRNCDTSKIKDKKEKEKIEKAKQQVALKKYKKENNLTKEQKESINRLNEILGI